jgi:hypothetical protein
MPKIRKVMKIERPQYLQKLIEAETNGAVKVVLPQNSEAVVMKYICSRCRFQSL